MRSKDREIESDAAEPRWLEGIFEMRGIGKELWRGEDPDEYVRKLREGWDEPSRSLIGNTCGPW